MATSNDNLRTQCAQSLIAGYLMSRVRVYLTLDVIGHKIMAFWQNVNLNSLVLPFGVKLLSNNNVCHLNNVPSVTLLIRMIWLIHVKLYMQEVDKSCF